jgi:hypothetical protein
MNPHFAMMARYNAWAKARLYAEARAVSDESYRKDVGAFFRSLHGTLNHLLVTDRIWMRRFTGKGEHPSKLNAIMFDDLPSLEAARRAEHGWRGGAFDRLWTISRRGKESIGALHRGLPLLQVRKVQESELPLTLFVVLHRPNAEASLLLSPSAARLQHTDHSVSNMISLLFHMRKERLLAYAPRLHSPSCRSVSRL